MEIDFKKIVDNLGEGILIANVKTQKLVFVNNIFCDLTGYSQAELLNKTIEYIHPQKDLPYVMEQFRKQSEKQDALAKDMPVLKKDGSVIMFDINAIPLDIEGEKYNIGVFHDITERKRAEEALRASEERYRILFERSRDAVFITTREGKFVDFNQAFLELLGFSREELLKMTSQDTYVNPDDRDRFQREIGQKGFVKDFEVKLLKKDSAEIDCLITSSVRLDNDGNILGYQGIIRDITERKWAEEKIKESAEEWKRTFNAISDLIFIQNNDHAISKTNKAFAAALKARPEDLIGKKCYELLHKSNAPWPDCPFERTKKDKAVHIQEVEDVNIGIPLLITTSPIFNDKGELLGSMHIAKDITLIKDKEKELVKKIRNLEVFHKAAVGRELKMVELKKKIKELEVKQSGGS